MESIIKHYQVAHVGFSLSYPDSSQEMMAVLLEAYQAFECDEQVASAAGDTLLFHSSTVVKEGKAYLFLGKSGTGKSTHSGLWLKHIEGTRLLNDDNPVVYISHEGTPMVSGSPWSGKTPCYKNEEYPIGAIVQLRQAPENKIRKQTVIESYVSIKTSVSGKAWEKEIADGQHQTIEKLIGATRLYQLDCLPDAGAALLCSQTISL